jgi:site-specific recombinase XerD
VVSGTAVGAAEQDIKDIERLQEPTIYGNPGSASNVNRTIAVLKRMFNLAVREELADKNPCWKIKMLSENNTMDRILSVEGLELLMKYLPPHAAQVVHFAYLTGMRADEIFNLYIASYLIGPNYHDIVYLIYT